MDFEIFNSDKVESIVSNTLNGCSDGELYIEDSISENFTFDDARIEFDEEIFNDEGIRLLRIDYISHVAN